MQMSRKEIKRILLDRDMTIADLARRINRCRPYTSQVLYGHETSVLTRKAIAQVLDMKISDIWPDRNGKKAA